MASIAQLNAQISINGVQQAQRDLQQIGSQAQTAQTELRQLQTSSSETGTSLAEHLGGGLKSIGGGFVSFVQNAGLAIFSMKQIADTAVNVASALLQPAMNAEQMETAFTTLTGSTKAAHDEMQKLAAFAAKTPFETMAIDKAASQLLGFGFNAKEIIPDLTAIGDALSAVGRGSAAELDSVVNVFGKIHNQGKLTGETMQELADNGINAFAILEKQTGKTRDQLQAMIQSGAIPADDAIKMLTQGIEKNPIYAGGMAKQSGTLAGLLSTLKSNWDQMLASFGSPVIKYLEGVVSNLGTMLASQSFKDFAGSIGKGIATVLGDIGKMAGNVVPWFQHFTSELDKPSLQNFVRGATSLGTQLSFVFGIIEGIGKNAFAILMDHLSKLGSPTQNASSLLGNLGNIFSDLSKHVHEFGTWLSSINFGAAFDDLLTTGEHLNKEFGPSIQNIGKLLAGDFGREMKDAGQLAKEFGHFFTTEIVPALQKAEPNFEKLAHVVADDVVPAIFKIRGVIMDVVEHGFKTFGPIVEQILPKLIDLAGIIGGALADGLKFAMPYVVQMAKAVGDFAKDIMTRIAPIIKQWLDQMTKDFDAFQKVWVVIWPYLKEILKGVWDEIAGVVKIAWSIVSGIIKIGLDLLSGNWKQAWKDLQDMLKGVWEGVQQYFRGWWHIVQTIFSGALDGLKNGWKIAWDWINDNIVSKAGQIKDNIMKPFNQAKDAIGGVAKQFGNFLIDGLNTGIHGAIDFVNKFAGAVNAVSNAFGHGNIITPMNYVGIPHYAEGTQGHPQDGLAVVGERGRELLWLPKGAHVIPNGQTEKLIQQGTIPGYAGGTPGVNDILGWIGGGAQGILNNMLSSFHIGAPSLPGHLNDIAGAILGKAKDWALSWIGSIMPHFDFGGNNQGGGDFGGQISGSLMQWIMQAISLTHVPGSWAGALATIAMHESGGNPSAVNNWDINAQNGDPSRGLFQTIGATFAHYALSGHGNIFNPVDNAAAAIEYIISRYGSVFNVPGIVSMSHGGPYVGYANGTDNASAGWHWVGERGPELAYLPSGTRVVPNSQVGSVFNSQASNQPIIVNAVLEVDGRLMSLALLPHMSDAIRHSTGIWGV